MSALPPEADIRQRIEHVCFVPQADILRRREMPVNGGDRLGVTPNAKNLSARLSMYA